MKTLHNLIRALHSVKQVIKARERILIFTNDAAECSIVRSYPESTIFFSTSETSFQYGDVLGWINPLASMSFTCAGESMSLNLLLLLCPQLVYRLAHRRAVACINGVLHTSIRKQSWWQWIKNTLKDSSIFTSLGSPSRQVDSNALELSCTALLSAFS